MFGDPWLLKVSLDLHVDFYLDNINFPAFVCLF